MFFKDHISEKIDKNTEKLINIETENKEITKSIDAFEDIIDDKISKTRSPRSTSVCLSI